MNSKTKILIIDDERDVAHLTAKRIRANGYEVECLFEGTGAIEMIRKKQPHLILLDIWLPDISGIELFKILRQDKKLKNIPIIFFSADPSKESLSLQELGADGFVKKPYNPRDLLKIIRLNLDN